MKKTILVTGGAGFIGSNFIIHMLQNSASFREAKIINLDKLTYAGNLENLKQVESNPNYEFIEGDICDKKLVDNVFQNHEIDYVVNFAAESHVDRSIQTPEIFVKTNVLGTATLLNSAKSKWLLDEETDSYRAGVKFLQVSTDEVYGSLGESGFFTEETKLCPRSPYSASKASADLLALAYYETFKFPVNITRCSNNYGPFQFPEKLIPLVLNNLASGADLPIYGDGLNVRDWLFVEDHCRAIELVLEKGVLGQVYNVGGKNEKTNLELVQTVVKSFEKLKSCKTCSKIKHIVDRKGHDRRYAIDPSKIEQELGFKPSVSFENGIEKTVDWFLKNADWLENVVSGDYKYYYKNKYGNI